MKTANFVIGFIVTLVALVVLIFVGIAMIGVYKGMTTGEVLHAIGDASIFTKEFWTQTGGVSGMVRGVFK